MRAGDEGGRVAVDVDSMPRSHRSADHVLHAVHWRTRLPETGASTKDTNELIKKVFRNAQQVSTRRGGHTASPSPRRRSERSSETGPRAQSKMLGHEDSDSKTFHKASRQRVVSRARGRGASNTHGHGQRNKNVRTRRRRLALCRRSHGDSL